MKIYTKTGDKGKTGLFGGGRVKKHDLRVEAYGTVDELNSSLGLVRAFGIDSEVDALMVRVQSELFQLGADLATPMNAKAKGVERVTEVQVVRLEEEIDRFDAEIAPLREFILPGGTLPGAALNLARTICRRAERDVTRCMEEEEINPIALRYLNRLSDWMFTLARLVNSRGGVPETKWHKGAEETP